MPTKKPLDPALDLTLKPGTLEKNPGLTPKPLKGFLMPVDDAFTITGRGTVVTGQVERGTLQTGATVACIGFGKTAEYVVTAMSTDAGQVTKIKKGDKASLLLRGAGTKSVVRGMVVATPNSVKESKEFEAEIEVTKPKKTLLEKTPLIEKSKLKLQFAIRTALVTGTMSTLEIISKTATKVRAKLRVKLSTSVALEVGLPFTVSNGDLISAKGVVTKVILLLKGIKP